MPEWRFIREFWLAEVLFFAEINPGAEEKQCNDSLQPRMLKTDSEPGKGGNQKPQNSKNEPDGRAAHASQNTISLFTFTEKDPAAIGIRIS